MACIFFFQAEDGIRDGHVTGVQTCALPILLFLALKKLQKQTDIHLAFQCCEHLNRALVIERDTLQQYRSEERRVGKECRSRWSRDKSTGSRQIKYVRMRTRTTTTRQSEDHR